MGLAKEVELGVGDSGFPEEKIGRGGELGK